MPPKKALSNAAITRLSWASLVEQCELWGVPVSAGQLDLEVRAALVRKVADNQVGHEARKCCGLPDGCGFCTS